MVAKKKILITGGSGFVGSIFTQLLSVAHRILAPSRVELDCTDQNSVEKYIETHKPDCIIHCAAFTDNTKAEEERGNTRGECYRVNVLGTRNIVDACTSHSVYCLYISTGSVFAGTQKHSGPYTEDDPHTALEDLSWYGATKAIAEDYVHKKGAILRLSHPLALHGVMMGKSDYLHRMLTLLSEGRLYPLFVDQLFPVSDLESVSNGILLCIESKVIGTYHMVSTDLVSPYLLCMYAAQSLRMDSSRIRSVVFDDYISHVDMPKRYAKYCAISGVKTSKTFSLPAYGWKDVVEKSVRLLGNI